MAEIYCNLLTRPEKSSLDARKKQRWGNYWRITRVKGNKNKVIIKGVPDINSLLGWAMMSCLGLGWLGWVFV